MQQEHITLSLDALQPSPTNPRKTCSEKGLQELAASIKAEGLLQPVLVRPRGDYYEVVFGHRRVQAARIAGLAAVPCMVRAMTDAEVARAQIAENLEREDVHPLEEAEGYTALMQAHGVSADELVAQTGKSRSYIYGRLKLLHLTSELRKSFLAGEIGSEVALMLARLRNDKLQAKALGYIKGKYLELADGGEESTRRIRNLLHERFTLELKGAMFDTADALLLPDAGACSDCSKRSGNAPEYGDLVEAKESQRHFVPRKGEQICTDPECFDAKKKAHLKNKAAALAAKGKTVVDGNAARAAIDAYGNVKGQYIALKDVKDELAKARLAAQRDSKIVPPLVVTIQDPRTGKTVEAVKASELEQAGVKAKASETQKGRYNHAAEQRRYEEERRKLLAKMADETRVRLAILEPLRAAIASSPRCHLDLQLAARAAFAGVEWNDRPLLARLWQCSSYDQLRKQLGSMSTEQLTLLMIDCGLIEGVECKHSIDPAPHFFDAAKHYGIDAAAIRLQVQAPAKAGSTPPSAARAPEKAAAGAGAKKAAKDKPSTKAVAPAAPKKAKKQMVDAGSAGGSGARIDAFADEVA